MKYKRFTTFLIVLSMLFSTFVGASSDEENNVVARRTVHTVSPGLDYISSIEVFGGVRQEIHSFDYTPGSGTKIIPAYGNYIYGFNSVGRLVSSYSGDGRVVGGINTDFFITNTGIPLSCLIDDFEIVTSCDNRPAIGFKDDGTAVIGYPGISSKLSFREADYPIAHINKTPAIWGMYLLTDKFASTTKTSVESVEIVFRPFDKELTDIAVAEYERNISKEKTEDSFENIEDSDADDEYKEKSESEDEMVTEPLEISEEDYNDVTVEDADSEENHTNSVSENKEQNNIADSDEEVNEVNLDLYAFTDENLEPDIELNVVITEIRDGVKNGSIPRDSFVLCVPKEQFGYMVSDWQVGDEFVLSTEMDAQFLECSSIFGAGSVILADGEFVPQNDDSIFKYRNPRTAAGIREDGSVVFVCVDGRRVGESNGFTIRELADYLIMQGCTYAVNFDGGGSTTFYAADIGEAGANRKNIPSEGIERNVADGLIFVNVTEPTGERSYASLYPKHHVVYKKGATIDIGGDVLFADSNYHPSLGDVNEIVLSVDEAYGVTTDNIFTPNGRAGVAEIIAWLPENDEYFYVGFVDVTDSVTDIDFEASSDFLTPFDISADITISASLDTLPVTMTGESADWIIQIEVSDEHGETTLEDVDSSFAYIDTANLEFVPVKRGHEYHITAKMGDYEEAISIFAEAHPFADMEEHWASEMSYNMFKRNLIGGEQASDGSLVFVPDRPMTKAEFCAILVRLLGLETAEQDELAEKQDGDDDTTEFNIDETDAERSNQPTEDAELMNEDSLSEPFDAENEEMYDDEESEIIGSKLSDDEYQISDSDSMPEPEIDISDVPTWAQGYVSALFQNGIAFELFEKAEDGTYYVNGSEPITRMDVIRVFGMLLSETDAEPVGDTVFEDFAPESDMDSLYVNTMVSKGIITGYEDNTLRPNGLLSRAEAATVFSRYLNFNESSEIGIK